MKYLKTFEEINIGEPEVGDYVICKEDNEDRSDDKARDFTIRNIGKIVRISPNLKYKYDVSYENIPIKLYQFFNDINKEKCRPIRYDEIIYWSKNKEELIPFISSNKYNL